MREGRRVSQRRLFSCKTTLDKEAVPETQTQLHLNDLPEVLLIEIFRQLSTLPPVMLPEEEALYTRPLPFKTFQFPGEVHPGLRSYPFLGQVCRRWRQVMDGPAMLQLWSELVVDFGHELITGVHVPVAWSDVRPSDEDFQAAFAAVRLRSHRLVDFVRARRGVLRSLVLCHSEGFWGDDGEFVPLASKHDFSLGTLGILLGLVADKLTALKMDRCNDLFAGGSPISTIAMLRGLRSLTLDGLQCRVYREQLSELGRLTGLQQLCISAAQGQGQGMSFMCGVDAVPDSWSNLKDLRQLELRGHALLEVLPPWLPGAMPQLEALDVTGCSRLDPSCLAAFTQLQTLAMQALDLVCGGTPERLVTQAALHGVPVRVKQLPDLGHMTRLRALNLSDNNLCRLPPWLPKLRQLEVLDLSGNFFLAVDRPVPPAGLAGLSYLDLRQVHVEEELRFWSPAKCATMQHITALSKALRRKNRHCQVLYDTS